jgi:hypothetical protein
VASRADKQIREEARSNQEAFTLAGNPAIQVQLHL